MFKLPDEVKADVRTYRDSLQRLIAGDISAARFKGVRVPWGVYSQRKNKGNMTRVRFPAGVASGKQLKGIAEAAKRFSNGMLHVTDRQDIQIHNVPLEDTGDLIEFLLEYELSPRGGGGNTVRNITACPRAGICKEEAFDVRGHAIQLTELMLPEPESYTLPRKYKISFSGCGRDCAHATVNDVGFIAKTKAGKKGFTVYVGGGLGSSSRVGRLFEEFLPESDVPYIAEAVKRVFHDHGNRKDKHHARLRFFIEDKGLSEFKRLYIAELDKLRREGSLPKIKEGENEIIKEGSELSDDSGNADFELFRKHNIQRQIQQGTYSVEIRIPNGDITSDELATLASVADEFPGVGFRTTQRQNILITDVEGDAVLPLYEYLRETGFSSSFASTVIDIVCCAGASTCNLGICDSKAMNLELIRKLERNLSPEHVEALRGFTVNINGCPNSCGHAPIGSIGLVGMTRRIDNKMVPFYKVFLGGVVEEGKTRLNEQVGVVPARNAPDAVMDFLVEAAQIRGKEEVSEFMLDEGRTLMEKILEKFARVPPYDSDPSFYRDWEKKEDFTLAGIGSAECGAGVLEIIESDIADAEDSLKSAEKAMDASRIRAGLHFASRALLVVRGIDPATEEETFEGFGRELVEKGFISPEFATIREIYASTREDSSDEKLQETMKYAKRLLDDVKAANKGLDNIFNFEKRY